jgi:DNA-binding CsgD family transcriptional regulator/tetratricopeptide (TPR) repeat protein
MGGRVSSPTFVGRVEELGVLEAARVRATNAEPAIVLVGGEAGVGKTRLVAELSARCAVDGTRVLAGGCVPVGEGGLPYAPIVEALRGLIADLGADTLRGLIGPSWPELARLLPVLGEPRAAGPADEHAQARLFELLLGLLGRLGEQVPLVLVVEDLHWADRSTRDLLAFLARNLRRERVLLAVTYRSDETGRARLRAYLAELDRVGRVRRLELPRFAWAETLAQLTGILGATPATDLAEAVFARSEGNPLFTEELLETVRAGSGALPETLRDLLQGRAEALPEPARQVLGAAAVAGRRVADRLLAAVTGLGDREQTEALRAAVAHQLLVAWPGGDGYEFRHALLREAVYAGLLPGERARLHAALAVTIAAHPSWAGGTAATVAAELAYHWQAAGDLEQALPAAIEAGGQAARTFAFAEAWRHDQHALELWARVPQAEQLAPIDRVALLERAAEAAHLVDDDPRAAELLREALQEVDRDADPVRAGLLQERLGDYLWMSADPAALAAYEEAVRLVPAEPPSVARARVLVGYAEILGMLGKDEERRPASREALATARRAGARREEGRALTLIGVDLALLGDIDTGLAHLRDARRIAEEQADIHGLGEAALQLGWVSEEAGRLEEAVAAALDGAAACRRLGATAWSDGLEGTAAFFEFLLGRWEEADRHFRGVLERDRLTGPKGVHRRLERARLDIARGDFAAARRLLQDAGRVAVQGGQGQFDAQFAAPLAIARAELALWEGRGEEAFQVAIEGLDVLARLGFETLEPVLFALGVAAAVDRAELASARRAAAEVEAARRDGDQLLARLDAAEDLPNRGPETAAVRRQCQAERARLHGRPDPAAWARAAAGWETLAMPYPAACARLREAEALLASRAPRARVEAALQAAHQIATQLGAGPLRRKLELLARRGRARLEATAQPGATEPPAEVSSLGLTRREAEVLALVAAGRTNRQIGEALFITPKTASIHVSRILAKLGVTGRVEAATIAHRLGLVE